MNINVHIERLVLNGVPVPSGEGESVQAAVETELTHLLADKGIQYPAPYAVPHISAAAIRLTRDAKPSSLGHQIAEAIYGSFRPATTSPRETRFHGGERG